MQNPLCDFCNVVLQHRQYYNQQFNWQVLLNIAELSQNNQITINNNNNNIGLYSPSERKKLLEKYKLKRKQRLQKKTVRYPSRKKSADNRLRVNGRFIKKIINELNIKNICSRY